MKKKRSDALQILNNKANVVDIQIVVARRSYSLTSANLRTGVPLLISSTNNVYGVGRHSLSLAKAAMAPLLHFRYDIATS